MNRLSRYMLRQLAIGLVAVTGGLAVLIWLTQSLRFLELVLNRGLSLAVFFELTVFMLPNFVAVILPVTTFIVILAVYSRMEDDRELVVMRAAGMGPMALARPALVLAGAAALLGWTMNLWVVPESYRAFREYQFEIRNRMAAVLLQEGVFNPLGEGLTVYIRERDRDGDFRGIMVHDTRTPGAPATILAERGWLTLEGDTPRVTLQNGTRQEVDRRTGTLRILSFAENTLSLATEAARDEVRHRDARERGVLELLSPDPAEQISARDRGRFTVEAHQRLAGPLATLSLALVGLAALLTGQFSRHGKTGRVLIAVGIGGGLVALGVGIGNLAARELGLVPLIWAQAVLPGVIALVWLLHPARARVPAAELAPG
ncbi:LPS export ABC transporter permease LptF [Elioraea sp.]|uniref:LPS export ABC transporter permease LptF n=1 Tax=Elioraea sp. TaxID=2185103 RepID=UPI003F6E717C